MLLESKGDFEVVAEVDNGRDVLHVVADLRPDIVLMDLSMPNTNGTEAIREVKRRHPLVKLITLTTHKAEEYIHAALGAGADGYVLKDDSHGDLLLALRSVMAGKNFLSPSVCSNVVTGYLRQPNPPAGTPSWHELTRREREVLKLVAEGYRNKDIAAYLSLSHKTVEKHRSNLMRKLDLHSASALTTYAIENGLISC